MRQYNKYSYDALFNVKTKDVRIFIPQSRLIYSCDEVA